MKSKALLIHFAILFSSGAFAQNELALSSPQEQPCEKYCILELFPEAEIPVQTDEPSGACFLVDAGTTFLPVRDVCLPGISFNLGGANTDFASAFSFDGVF